MSIRSYNEVFSFIRRKLENVRGFLKIVLRPLKMLICVLLVRSKSYTMGSPSRIANWPTENMAGKVDLLGFEP